LEYDKDGDLLGNQAKRTYLLKKPAVIEKMTTAGYFMVRHAWRVTWR